MKEIHVIFALQTLVIANIFKAGKLLAAIHTNSELELIIFHLKPNRQLVEREEIFTEFDKTCTEPLILLEFIMV